MSMFEYWIQNGWAEFWIPIISFFLFLVFNSIYLFIAWKISRWVVSKIWLGISSAYRTLDGSNKIKLISISCASIFTPFVIPTIFDSLIAFSVTLVYEFASRSLEGWKSASSVCNPSFATGGLGRFGDGIATCVYSLVWESTNSFLDSFLEAFIAVDIYNFPYRSFLYFLAISLLLSSFLSGVGTDEGIRRRLYYLRDHFLNFLNILKESAYRFFRNPIALANAAFFLVLFLGLYLSIASIAAIPNLQANDSSVPEVSVDKLRERLDESLADFQRDFPVNSSNSINSGLGIFEGINAKEKNPLSVLEEEISRIKLLEVDNIAFMRFLIDQDKIDYENSDFNIILSVLSTTEKRQVQGALGIPFEETTSEDSQSPIETIDNQDLANDQIDEELEVGNDVYDLSRSKAEILSIVLKNLNDNQIKDLSGKVGYQLTQTRQDFLEANFFVDEHRRRRARLIEDSDKELVQVNKDLEGSLVSAINDYEISIIARKGDRETFQHFLAISTWYDSKIIEAKTQFENCLQSIQDLDALLGEEADFHEESIATYQMTLSENPQYFSYFSPRETASRRFIELDESARQREGYEVAWKEAEELCLNTNDSLDTENSLVPQRPELGQNLGPFRFVASWLLETESLPLALITGLLGFGLLGAACSSFIQERILAPQHAPDENQSLLVSFNSRPLVEDLPRVIVIGFSAAILAFLTVLGGVSIFSTGASEPSPYALLLTCLVASVFGETFWKRARNKFIEQEESTED